MSAPLTMYIVSNGELVRAALNAVVTLVGSDTFSTVIKFSLLFSIFGASINYIRGHDLAAFGKWFLIYFGITTIMLGPKVTVAIHDISNEGSIYVVDNVPYGLAFPASIITSVSYSLVQAVEEAFQMPDDVQYHKTGMLFGSKLFRLSTEFSVANPAVKAELDEYVKSCVLGDILVSKKYSMSQLVESTNILETITKDTSKIRGIYVGNEFKTCDVAAIELKKHVTQEVKDNIFKSLGRKLGFGSVSKRTHENKLTSVYNFFNYGGLSHNALEIATQNLLINGMRDGILNYTAETGSTAAMLNLSNTLAMDKMRMTLATSRNMALYTIPLIHTILLILMLGLFPIIILIAFQPSLTGTVLKNYIGTIIWIESWPLMFACLNMMVTFYAKDLGPSGLTMGNIDSLLLEHSDIANMAGYLMLSIPFISGGLVKGMSSAFNTAASYIGGVLQSSASSAAAEAASGNISLGNSSWNNVNANKFDTNSTLMSGMSTKQLSSGVLRHGMADGTVTYDSSHAISRLPADLKTSELISNNLTAQASAEKSAATQAGISYDKHLSRAMSEYGSLSNTLDSRRSIGENFSTRESQSVATSAAKMKSIATDIAQRNNVDANEVFKSMTQSSASLKAGIGKSFSLPVGNFKTDLGVNLGLEASKSHDKSTQHTTGRSASVTAQEMNSFREEYQKVRDYSKTHSVDSVKSEADSHLVQLSTDLRNSESIARQQTAHLAESERLSDQASYVKQNSAQFDINNNQMLAEYIVNTVGRERAEELFTGKNNVELAAIATDFVGRQGIGDDIMAHYQKDSIGINPSERYQTEAAKIEMVGDSISNQHSSQKHKLNENFHKFGKHFEQNEFNTKQGEIQQNQQTFDGQVQEAQKQRDREYGMMKSKVETDIAIGAKKSQTSSINILADAHPEYTKED